jgi:flagellin-like hook-associated protein FlgL
MRQNLLSLQKTQALMDLTQNRLATGKKVNSAMDNAANFFAAAALTNRASDLDVLLDAMGQAVQTLTAADHTITSLTKLMEQAKATAQSARDTANVASHTSTKNLVGLSTAGAGTTAGVVGDLVIRSGVAVELRSQATTFESLDQAMPPQALASFQVILADGTNITAPAVTVGAGAAGMTVRDYLEAIELAGEGKITARLSADGELLIRSTDGSAIRASAATAHGFDMGTTVTGFTAGMTISEVVSHINAARGETGVHARFDADSGTIQLSGLDGQDLVMSGDVAEELFTLGAGESRSAVNGVNNRGEFSVQFNNTLNQINQLVQNRDGGYRGTNLVNGDSLTVNFNESRTSSLTIKGVYLDTRGLGVATAQNEWVSNSDIDRSLGQIEGAVNALRLQASEFAQNLTTVQTRQDFTKNMIETLTSGADKLTLADMNEESANMLALQTRQQLGVNALSLASQSAQSVLRLF